MPSVFTIEGTDVPPPKKSKRPRKVKAAQLGDVPAIGACKTVHNPRTGCEMQLCYVGLGAPTRKGKKSRTGWEFQEGSSRCPTRR
jgi:hypothetical protein